MKTKKASSNNFVFPLTLFFFFLITLYGPLGIARIQGLIPKILNSVLPQVLWRPTVLHICKVLNAHFAL